jgi:hypothetical protein
MDLLAATPRAILCTTTTLGMRRILMRMISIISSGSRGRDIMRLSIGQLIWMGEGRRRVRLLELEEACWA